MKLFLDLETYSPVPLAHGTHAYSEKAEVLLLAWARESGPATVWDVTSNPTPDGRLCEDLASATELWWFNGGMFDRVVLEKALRPVYDMMPDCKWRDAMVQALSHSLPGSLADLCAVYSLGEDTAKDKEGGKLINLFCKPDSKGRRNDRVTHPELWEAFVRYAEKDVLALRVLHAKMPKLNYPNNAQELGLWKLDQVINRRGLPVDVALANAAKAQIARSRKALAGEVAEATGGEVESPAQRDKFLDYLGASLGMSLPDLKKATVSKLLSLDDVPAEVKALLSARLAGSMTSGSKYATLIRGVSSDGRLRGLMQFCGAARTGRVAHRLFQPGNLPRPDKNVLSTEMGGYPRTLPPGDRKKEEKKRWGDYLRQGVSALKADIADVLFESPLSLTSNLIRGVVRATDGSKLVVSDLANIEGRVAAWLTGTQWKLDAFSEYDRGVGEDLYKIAYSRSFGVPVESVGDQERQIGKVEELAFGYGGGVGAWLTMSATYALDLDGVRKTVFSGLDSLPPQLVRSSFSMWEWAVKQKKTLALAKDVFVACDIVKRAWREAHPGFVTTWEDLAEAMRTCVMDREAVVTVGLLKVERRGGLNLIRLPSGRFLVYPKTEIGDDGGLSYLGKNQYTRKWSRIRTYGGKLFENVCQAVARDILFYAMPRVEAAGYRIVLSVHDELVTECERGGHEELSGLLAQGESWSSGLPLAAAGFEAERYGKG